LWGSGLRSPGAGPYPGPGTASTSPNFANSLGFFVNVGSMQFTQRQRHLAGRWRPLLAAIPVGLLLGFAGPFGSYPAFPTATRYLFWLGLTAVGAAGAVGAAALPPLARLRAGPIRVGAVALLSALPTTFVVAWAMSLVQPGRTSAPQQLLGLFWGVAAVQLLIAYVTTFEAPTANEVREPVGAPPAPEPGADSTPAAFPPALVTRLPPEIGRAIVALETEDHYLRVHALGGDALVLMRMADAIALIDSRLGAQVHRRWWVAEAAVAGMRTEGQRIWLCLVNGMSVPVGRTFAAATRARFGHAGKVGWPDQA
jgi:hypothetical protein